MSFDEVGRGSVFGPVTVAAVKIPVQQLISLENLPYFSEIKDSKELTALSREILAEKISKDFEYGISHVGVGFIDKYNINTAIQYAIYRLTQSLNSESLLFLLIDGNYRFNYPNIKMPKPMPPIHTQIKGDSLCFSIACASILAKVCRDRLISNADLRFPEYQLKKNKGYGTANHLSAIRQWGLSHLHRKSFLKKV